MENNLPKDWVRINFQDCLSDEKFTVGKIKQTEYLEKGKYPVIDQSKDFISGYCNDDDKVYKGSLPVIVFGDHTNVIKYITFSFVSGADGTKILNLKKDKINVKFFYYLLENYKPETQGYRRHYTLLKELVFPLPPHIEQTRISEKLEILFQHINRAISLLEENIDNTEYLMASAMNVIYEVSQRECWDNVFIKDAFNMKTGGTPSTTQRDRYYGGCIKWLVSGDINQVEIFDCENRITEEGMKSSNAKMLPPDTILIALNGQGKTRGSVAMLKTEATCNQSLVGMITKDKNKYDPEYLFYNLKSRYIEIRMMTGLNERRGLNMKLIGNIEVPFPSIEKQREIVSYFKKTFKNVQQLKVSLESKLSYLNSLKSSILVNAFKGEL